MLVIDDEEQIRALLDSTLRFAGFDVVQASDATSALRACSASEIDVIVLDVGLPDIDGFDMVRILRSRDVVTPVLMLTARTEVDDRVLGLGCRRLRDETLQRR